MNGSNTIYKRFRDRGYEVFPVNPNADDVEERLLATTTDRSTRARVGAGRHRHGARPGRGHDARVRRARYRPRLASSWARKLGASPRPPPINGASTASPCIDGGCPLMFGPTGHSRSQAHVVLAGRVPKTVWHPRERCRANSRPSPRSLDGPTRVAPPTLRMCRPPCPHSSMTRRCARGDVPRGGRPSGSRPG